MNTAQLKKSLRTLVARNEELAGKAKDASDNDDVEELELAIGELVDTAGALAELCQAIDQVLGDDEPPAAEPPKEQLGD